MFFILFYIIYSLVHLFKSSSFIFIFRDESIIFYGFILVCFLIRCKSLVISLIPSEKVFRCKANFVRFIFMICEDCDRINATIKERLEVSPFIRNMSHTRKVDP